MVCHHAHSSFAGGGRTKDGDDVARSNRARPLCLRWARERKSEKSVKMTKIYSRVEWDGNQDSR